ncbi:NAD(P)/FAD-dependent oxidoreductase [Campylobacter sp. FMV-PI01]|uniref:NAD(P)/FAD-dependent oxidoreductase n=1 Tax=Campylobacter portucalensis TaxID=2608384 RepID=A0A6L5WGA6_9BACT|nr:FAD-dependent oxidoreductase [Campylobacter portucalensis]MSN96064.1 NAD(P)/FAD-dependent oxidoreductase [Campylobacter portucalensis]
MNYDFAIIGFGKAGKTLAIKMANIGKKVALIEKSKNMYGGTCINIGCIPTKKLLNLSKEARFYEDKKEYFKSAMKQKNELITTLRAKNYAMLNDNKNIDIIDGVANFLDENHINIAQDNGKNITISANKFIINTGSYDKIPSIKIDSNQVYTSKEILDIENLPDHLVVIGSGFIGLEFASMFANFGSKVSILIRKDEFLPNEDEDVKNSVKNELEAQGIEILLEAKPLSINNDTIIYKSKDSEISLKADAFLLATGRVANTKSLNLESANVKLNSDESIVVNEFLQTTNPNIYAVGDAKGGEFFTYISLDDYRIIFSHLFGDKKRTTNNRPIHANVLFTNTPLAKIGLKEKDVLDNDSINILKLPLANIPNAKILGKESGFLKAIVDTKNKKILGATFHCIDAHELINEIALIMQLDADISIFKNQIFTHPSISEALNDLFANA